MRAGGPAQPSPTLGAAMHYGYKYLRVRCSCCHQAAFIELTKIDRPATTPVWKLEGALACKPCHRDGARALHFGHGMPASELPVRGQKLSTRAAQPSPIGLQTLEDDHIAMIDHFATKAVCVTSTGLFPLVSLRHALRKNDGRKHGECEGQN